jgi:DNA repair protein RadC
VASGKIIDIPVVDHIIVANKKFLSMREDGYM